MASALGEGRGNADANVPALKKQQLLQDGSPEPVVVAGFSAVCPPSG
jgi:hypothetical protein